MDRVFLDANVLFSAARSRTSRLRSLWSLSDSQMLTSALAFDEARRNLALDRPAALADLDSLAVATTIVPDPDPAEPLPPNMCLPEKDRSIFLAAVGAHATHFLTGDKRHFGPYRGQTIAGVIVLIPADYLSSRST